MDFLEKHGYDKRKINDCHIHQNRPYPIAENIEHFKTVCDRFGIDKMVLLAILDVTSSYEVVFADNATALYMKDILYPRAYAFASFLHIKDEWQSGKDTLRQAKEYWDIGFDGIKMLEGKT